MIVRRLPYCLANFDQQLAIVYLVWIETECLR